MDGPWAVASSLHLKSLEWDGRTSRGQHSQADEVRILAFCLKMKSLNKDSQSKVTKTSIRTVYFMYSLNMSLQ